MATQLEFNVGIGVEVTKNFELPIPGTIGTQNDTFISILAIQPDPSGTPATATYTIVHSPSGDEATVPSTVGSTANIGDRGTVELVSINNGLSVIHMFHTPAVNPDNEQMWAIRVNHEAAVPVDFFAVVGHSEVATQIPRLTVIIGGQKNPAPAILDFGRATFNVAKTLSVTVFNTGTAEFDIDSVSLENNESGFYSISTDPSSTTVSPNTHDPVEIDYLPSPPPPVGPHTAQLKISSSTGGVNPSERVIELTGNAVFREIVLCIDVSNSMNWTNDGTPLSGCPVGATLAPNFDRDSRIRQARTALQVFQSKLIEYGDQQTQLAIVQFPGGHLACGSSHNDALASAPGSWKTTIQSLNTFSASDPNVPSNIESATNFGYYHSTPMKAGLQAAMEQFTSDPGKYRVIMLLSDGAHNVPPDEHPKDLIPDLTTISRPIRVLAIGFGENESVDHPLLQDLADETVQVTDGENPRWSGFFAFNPAADGNEDLLETFYNKLFTDIFELQEAVDPTAQIAAGGTNTHPVLVTEFDKRIAFSISWTTPQRDLLLLTLIAPNGQRIGPKSDIARYYSGPKHKMYAVDLDQLEADFIGQWQMEVTYQKVPIIEITNVGEPGGAATVAEKRIETYNYNVIMRSGLELDVKFDKHKYFTGDRVVIFGRLTENGRPLLNQTVKVQLKRPDHGMGNWFADHPVALETIEKAVSDVLGPTSAAAVEQITMVNKKSFYLNKIQSIALPAHSLVFPADGLDMLDNGQNGDIQAHDGVYTAVLSGVAIKPDTYAFTVVATGTTSGGHAFRRERTIHLNIQPRIDLTFEFTQVSLTFLEGDFGPGIRRFKALIRPQDPLGNLLGPGHAAGIKISSSLARPLTGVMDDLIGGYYRTFELVEGTGVPLVDFEIQGKPLPTQMLPPEGLIPALKDQLTQPSLLLLIALILALIIVILLIIYR